MARKTNTSARNTQNNKTKQTLELSFVLFNFGFVSIFYLNDFSKIC